MTDFQDMPLAVKDDTEALEDLELGVDDGGFGEEETSTSFDDVALSLLLFFMVLSLFASFADTEEQSKGTALAKLPAVGGEANTSPDRDDMDTIILFESEGQLFLRHRNSEGKDGQEVEIQKRKLSDLKKKLLQMIKAAKPDVPSNRAKSGVMVVIQLSKDTPYGQFLPLWKTLTKLHREDDSFRRRVAMVAWGQQTQKKEPGGAE